MSNDSELKKAVAVTFHPLTGEAPSLEDRITITGPNLDAKFPNIQGTYDGVARTGRPDGPDGTWDNVEKLKIVADLNVLTYRRVAEILMQHIATLKARLRTVAADANINVIPTVANALTAPLPRSGKAPEQALANAAQKLIAAGRKDELKALLKSLGLT